MSIFHTACVSNHHVMLQRGDCILMDLISLNGIAWSTDWIGGLEGVAMTQIIASISQPLRCEALLMKRAKLTEAQLFVVDRYMK